MQIAKRPQVQAGSHLQREIYAADTDEELLIAVRAAACEQPLDPATLVAASQRLSHLGSLPAASVRLAALAATASPGEPPGRRRTAYQRRGSHSERVESCFDLQLIKPVCPRSYILTNDFKTHACPAPGAKCACGLTPARYVRFATTNPY